MYEILFFRREISRLCTCVVPPTILVLTYRKAFFIVCCFSWRDVRVHAVRDTLSKIMVLRASEHVVSLEQPKKCGAEQDKTAVVVF